MAQRAGGTDQLRETAEVQAGGLRAGSADSDMPAAEKVPEGGQAR